MTKIDHAFWDDLKLNEPRIGPMSPADIKFMLAGIELVLEGTYPSGRQILKKLGREKRLEGKCNLNGRESELKSRIFVLFRIRPYLGYTRNRYREGMNYLYSEDDLYERDRHGNLVRIKKIDNE